MPHYLVHFVQALLDVQRIGSPQFGQKLNTVKPHFNGVVVGGLGSFEGSLNPIVNGST